MGLFNSKPPKIDDYTAYEEQCCETNIISTVYTIFVAYGDPDDNLVFKISCEHNKAESAYACAKSMSQTRTNKGLKFNKAHINMDQYHIYVGNRKYCENELSMGTHGGYIIEKLEIME